MHAVASAARLSTPATGERAQVHWTAGGEGEEQCVRPCVLKFTTLAMVGVTGLPDPWFSRPIGLFSRKIEGENCHRDLAY